MCMYQYCMDLNAVGGGQRPYEISLHQNSETLLMLSQYNKNVNLSDLTFSMCISHTEDKSRIHFKEVKFN